MSKRLEATVECRNCGHAQHMTLFRTLWVEYSEIMSLVLNDKVNEFCCKKCKYVERLEFPFLCTNVTRSVAIWYEPYHDEQIDEDIRQYQKHMGANSFYAKAQRIADWETFKAKLLEMNEAGPQPSQETRPSTKSKSFFRGFIDSLRHGRPRPVEKAKTSPSVGEVIETYGALLEDYPSSILDSSMLPVPKPQMKAILKTAYRETRSEQMRRHFEVGFMFLSLFQDGVGPTPIDGNLSEGDVKSNMLADMAALNKWIPWQERSSAEMERLLAEWNCFKEGG